MDTQRISGPARQLFQFVKTVKQGKFSFILCSFQRKGEKDTTEFIEAAKEYFSLRYALYERCRFDPMIFWQSYRLCKSAGIDIVQTHNYKAAVVGLFCKYFMGIKWVAFTHGWTNEDFKVKFYNFLEPFILRFADTVITVSKALKEKMIKHGVPRKKCVTVHNAIDGNFGNTLLDGYGDIRDKYSIPPKAEIISVIGRLSLEKGHRYFLEAFKMTQNKRSDIYAFIIGEGPEEEQLKKQCTSMGIDRYIKFVGYQKDMHPFYMSSDVVVLSSLSEGLPNVVLESLAYGVLVVATSVGGVPEIIEDGYNGILVPLKDSVAISNALIRVLDDSTLRDSLSKNGKETVKSKFSPITRANRLMDIYYDVLGR